MHIVALTPRERQVFDFVIRGYPDRFVLGSVVVAPSSIDAPMKVYLCTSRCGKRSLQR
jgi:FixJ family two-component response regulator